MEIMFAMNVNKNRYSDFLQRRLAYFQQLLKFNYNFEVWSEINRSNWSPISTFDINELASDTCLHREILPNEWVFDIDGKSWESVRELAINLEEIFEKYGIVFDLWSSGNWLHYHVFTSDEEIVQTQPEWYKKLIKYHFSKLLKNKILSINELITFQREVHKAIPLVLLRELKKIRDAHIDLLKLLSEKCLIRAEGSLNPKTGAFKTFLGILPQHQPLVKNQTEVKFPNQIEVWKPDIETYDNLFLLAYWKFIRTKYVSFTAKRAISGEGRRISWIENLLQNPLPDGRHRAVDLILAPYLMNVKKLAEEEAFKMIWDWVERSKQINYTRMTQSYVRNKLRYAKRKELKPLSKANLDKWFGDVPQLLKHSG